MVVNVFFSAVTQATMSRHDLLAWVNASLQANLTKIEEMSTGAAYCGLTDLLFPGTVPIKKVKWNSKSEVDYINNWNILQKSWKEIGVDKPVPVDRLLRAKFQENFEFLQWFKKFYDANWAEHDYDPVEARNGEDFPAALPGGAKAPAVAKVTAARAAPKPAPTSTVPKVAPTAPKPAAAPRNAPTTRTSILPAKQSTKQSSSTPSSNGTASVAAVEAKYKQKIDELNGEVAALTETATTLEKERDFYFTKLRAVEILCQETGPGKEINIDRITQILYELDEGFEPAENGGQTVENQLDITQDLTENIPTPEPIKDEEHEKEHVEQQHNGGGDVQQQQQPVIAATVGDLDDDQTF